MSSIETYIQLEKLKIFKNLSAMTTVVFAAVLNEK